MSALIAFILSVGFSAEAPVKKPITSVSYESVVSCFPDAKDPSLSQAVDLNRLRERLELFLVTDRKRLEKRVVKFKDDAGFLHRATLEEKTDPAKPLLGQQLFATWETVSDAGTSTPWDPGLPKKFTIVDVNKLLARGQILNDDRIDVDTKLKGMTLRVRRSQNKVVELSLVNTPEKWSLKCEDRGETGSICICNKAKLETSPPTSPTAELPKPAK